MADSARPPTAFNFWSTSGRERGGPGGFSDVSGLDAEITVAEYRNGNDTENHVRKIPGVHKVGDVTLKRGVIGAQNLCDWMERARNGDSRPSATWRSR